jgi:hypothetical protein
VAFAPQIDPGNAASNYWQSLDWALSACIIVAIAVLHVDLSEHDRPGWPEMESGLGECHKGLANVQLPSWSHAGYAAYARMNKGL